MTDEEAVRWMREIFQEIPITRLLGAQPVSYDGDAARVAIDYTATPEFCNLLGTVHGGILTAMLDNVMSFAALCGLGPGHATPSIEIKTSYIAPAKPGLIKGEGHVVRQGRTIVFIEGRLTDPDGKLLTTATATAQARALTQ